MMYNRNSVEEICKKLKPVIGQKADGLFLAWRMAETPEKRIQIEQAVNALYVKYLDSSMLNQTILLEPPAKEQVHGKFEFGKVVYAGKELYPFGLREQDFPRHVCITGMSGSGKTNLGIHILKTFMEKNIPFIVFDWKKSFRQLLRHNKDLLVFTIGNETIANLFSTNVNEPPPMVGPKEWISILADLANESFYASHGVHKLISETLDEAFREFKVYSGSKNYPTWHQIKDRLVQKEDDTRQGREREWITSAVRIAHALTFGGFGEAINSKDKYGIKIQDIIGKKVVFELHALGQSEKKFFSEYLLTYIFRLKKAMLSDQSREFSLAIVVDEAHNIFLKDKTFFLKESITESIYREIREYGVSLICMDQHISKLSDVVPGNSACNIVFQQMLPQDIITSSGVMQLFDKKEYFSMLPVGSCIVRLAERYHQPFLVQIPLSDQGAKVNDSEILSHMTKVIGEYRMRQIIADCPEDDDFVITEQKEINITSPPPRQTSLNPQEIETHNTYPDEINAAEQRIQQQKQRLEIKYRREQQKAFDKLEQKKQQETEKLAEKELRKIAVITNPNEPKTLPRNTEHEALSVLHGPDKFIVPQTLGSSRSDGFNKEEFPHLGSISHSNTSITTSQHFVAAVQQHPDYSITQLYKLLGLSARKGTEIKDELVKTGVLRVTEVKTPKGWKKLLRTR